MHSTLSSLRFLSCCIHQCCMAVQLHRTQKKAAYADLLLLQSVILASTQFLHRNEMGLLWGLSLRLLLLV